MDRAGPDEGSLATLIPLALLYLQGRNQVSARAEGGHGQSLVVYLRILVERGYRTCRMTYWLDTQDRTLRKILNC